MSQSWLVPILAGDTVTTALTSKTNDALASLRSRFSGATPPSATTPFMPFADTALKLIRSRDAADAAWLDEAALGARNHLQVAHLRIPGLAVSANDAILVPRAQMKILGLTLVTDIATAGSTGGNNWAVQVRNMTAGNNLRVTAWDTNTDAELALDAQNYIAMDQNQDVSVGDVLEVQVTKNGTPTDLTAAKILYALECVLRGA